MPLDNDSFGVVEELWRHTDPVVLVHAEEVLTLALVYLERYSSLPESLT
ncbi:MAG TPA: hypothetical protein VFA68_00030 [Terriglobales bacterium]|jgi:hypothetical protein|nr:hypothetical protein [Terriglobales bacterium]